MGQNGPWVSQGINGATGIVGLLFDPYLELIMAHVGKKVAEHRPLKSLYRKSCFEKWGHSELTRFPQTLLKVDNTRGGVEWKSRRTS